MKNWSPSLVKNLEPLTEIVGMALTVARPARNQERIAESMVNIQRRLSIMERYVETGWGDGRAKAWEADGRECQTKVDEAM